MVLICAAVIELFDDEKYLLLGDFVNNTHICTHNVLDASYHLESGVEEWQKIKFGQWREIAVTYLIENIRKISCFVSH